MFRNVVFSCGLDFEGPPLLSLSRAHSKTRDERRTSVVAGFFCRFGGAHRTRGKKTDDFGREAKMSFLCVNVPIQTNNKN